MTRQFLVTVNPRCTLFARFDTPRAAAEGTVMHVHRARTARKWKTINRQYTASVMEIGDDGKAGVKVAKHTEGDLVFAVSVIFGEVKSYPHKNNTYAAGDETLQDWYDEHELEKLKKNSS